MVIVILLWNTKANWDNMIRNCGNAKSRCEGTETRCITALSHRDVVTLFFLFCFFFVFALSHGSVVLRLKWATLRKYNTKIIVCLSSSWFRSFESYFVSSNFVSVFFSHRVLFLLSIIWRQSEIMVTCKEYSTPYPRYTTTK